MTTPSDSLDLAKRQATLLTERLKALGVPLKRTQALEAVAATAGFEDWNRYQAHLATQGASASTLPGATTSTPGLPQRAGERHLVCLRPGDGKTTAMAAHCVLQQHRGKTFWVDLAGNPDNFMALPASLQNQLRPVTLRFDIEGRLLDSLSPPQGDLGLFVSLEASDTWYNPFSKAHENLLGAAMQNLCEQASKWGTETFQQFGTIVFDEFHRLGGRQAEVGGVIALAGTFLWDHADTLIATQARLDEYSMRILSTPFELSLPINDTGHWESPDLLEHVPHVHSIHAIGLGVPPLDDNAMDHFVNVLRVVRREVHMPEALSLGRKDGERIKMVLNLCYEAQARRKCQLRGDPPGTPITPLRLR